ncbi:hypothetical protein NA57DRAFT_79515 [Rhizodiscina lignyota]|uniref:Uncharacterized protein n=1 Tax=Rhizodiscina lignyota TaxID=1504668 RepID=A0A9P4I6X0_9PEZI|nr:hypothetical protein NA57DRAFT_79515 [Rhizodiscina lignyota]
MAFGGVRGIPTGPNGTLGVVINGMMIPLEVFQASGANPCKHLVREDSYCFKGCYGPGPGGMFADILGRDPMMGRGRAGGGMMAGAQFVNPREPRMMDPRLDMGHQEDPTIRFLNPRSPRLLDHIASMHPRDQEIACARMGISPCPFVGVPLGMRRPDPTMMDQRMGMGPRDPRMMDQRMGMGPRDPRMMAQMGMRRPDPRMITEQYGMDPEELDELTGLDPQPVDDLGLGIYEGDGFPPRGRGFRRPFNYLERGY